MKIDADADADLDATYVDRKPDGAVWDVARQQYVTKPTALVEKALEQGRDASAARPWLELYRKAAPTATFSLYTEFVRSMTVLDMVDKFPTLTYECLALSEESGEFAEKVWRYCREVGLGVADPILTIAQRHELALELGDVMFYVHLAYIALGGFSQPVQFDGGCLAQRALRLAAAVGKFDSGVKKLHRDHDGNLNTQRRAALMERLGNVWDALDQAGRRIGYQLGEIAELNIQKITSRLERGTLAGSGDHR